jgi:hypothetical protein
MCAAADAAAAAAAVLAMLREVHYEAVRLLLIA